jgi:hypothetical protein
LSEERRQELAGLIEAGPDPAERGVARWRLCDLRALEEQRSGATHQQQGLSKLIKRWVFAGTGRSAPRAIPSAKPR